MLNRIMPWCRRIGQWARREEFDRELAQELEFHLAMKQQERELRGSNPQRAREAA